MSRGGEPALAPLAFVFIALWWTCLVLFCSVEPGRLAWMWIGLGLMYMVLHPDALIPRDVLLVPDGHNIIHLIEVTGAVLVFAGFIGLFALGVAANDEAFAGGNGLMFVAVGAGFFAVAALVQVGIAGYLLVHAHSKRIHLYVALSGIFAAAVAHYAPSWRFAAGFVKFQHKIHLAGAILIASLLILAELLKLWRSLKARRARQYETPAVAPPAAAASTATTGTAATPDAIEHADGA